MHRLYILLAVILLSSCTDTEEIVLEQGNGMRPIYHQLEDNIAQETMQFDALTNIVVYQELILAMEENIGVHVIDNSDPIDPLNILFIPIRGVSQIVIKDNILIANSGNSLYSIDITDRSKAILKAITYIDGGDIENQYLYPEGYFGPFECVNPDKGYVVSWEEFEMVEYECWR